MVGKTLHQLCLGEHQVQLRLDDAEIAIEGIVDLDGVGLTVAEGHRLHILVGATVLSATVLAPGDLELSFSNGRVLVVRDSNAHYESYVVTAPGVHIVV
jgi:hypothetical protein